MRLIDLDRHETRHLICNLEPKWKPMAEMGPDELFHELGTVIEAFHELPQVDPVHAAGGCYCAECKNAKSVDIVGYSGLWCEHWNKPTPDKNFCGLGRKKGEEDD